MKKSTLIKTDVSKLSQFERFNIIRSFRIPKKPFHYLIEKLKNLTIEIGERPEDSIMDLMYLGLLEGWCWQTTESAIVFLKDDDFIERGNLKLEPHKDYWHSWISFNFDGENYVFDPCLRILIEKNLFFHLFEVTVYGAATAKEVRDDLIYRINHPKSKSYDEKLNEFLKKIFETFSSERQKTETYVSGGEDVNSPMYRNNTGYNAVIKNGKIESLIAHYYFNG